MDDKTPKWLTKRERVDDLKAARMEELHAAVRRQVESMEAEALRTGTSLATVFVSDDMGSVPRRRREPLMPKRPWLKRHPTDYPPAHECNVRDELLRLGSSDRPVVWHSPIRDQLIRDGLIVRCYDAVGLWVGDRLTDAGARAVRGLDGWSASQRPQPAR